jgi:coenzyme Q-binding protein COQ10
MPRHAETRFLPYRADQIYDLVADVARYPEFLPWTSAARIRSRRPIDGRGAGAEVMEADLVISFKVFRERFGSRVTLVPAESRIETDYLDGPFRYLHSVWHVSPAPGGCEVAFFVDFEFRNIVLQKVIGVVFDEAMRRVVAAFETRARALYDAQA